METTKNNPHSSNISQPLDHSYPPTDAEKQAPHEPVTAKKSIYAGLGWLDRLLALWILLAIVIGILLGNFVESVGPALQRGKFVGVSVPIGMHECSTRTSALFLTHGSGRSPRHDVSHPVQGEIRDAAQSVRPPSNLGAVGL